MACRLASVSFAAAKSSYVRFFVCGNSTFPLVINNKKKKERKRKKKEKCQRRRKKKRLDPVWYGWSLSGDKIVISPSRRQKSDFSSDVATIRIIIYIFNIYIYIYKKQERVLPHITCGYANFIF
eukprot:Rmarinus@m.17037